ncbi:DUF3473 domain-containing protein [Bacillus sp. OTU2372]|uniref:DUF3473 domain-containing protein n=1 Tax=Bacillus sp. OTU2372 TaxID=3043858 RepID=UPI00313BD979
MIFTVDVEDWFTNGRSIQIDSWDGYELKVEQNVYKILDLLEMHKVKGTFFILGWIAYKRPNLVRDIYQRGHEIASHGYSHMLVYTQSYDEFRQDIRKSKILLEDIIGEGVYGYRAPCFSITKWAYQILEEENFLYSSSIVPHNYHPLYSKVNLEETKYPFIQVNNKFFEFPLPAYKIFKMNIPWGGGGHFRLYPYSLYKYGLNKIKNVENSFVFYIHPYEIDLNQSSLKNNIDLHSLLGSYGIKTTYKKLTSLLNDFKFTSIREAFPCISP